MEIEQYCKCDACAKRILKSKAIQLITSRLCQECFDKRLKLQEEAMLAEKVRTSIKWKQIETC